ncbi:MAG: hypothetical protein ACOH1J_07295 [Microbacteriaceae bacterium]
MTYTITEADLAFDKLTNAAWVLLLAASLLIVGTTMRLRRRRSLGPEHPHATS